MRLYFAINKNNLYCTDMKPSWGSRDGRGRGRGGGGGDRFNRRGGGKLIIFCNRRNIVSKCV